MSEDPRSLAVNHSSFVSSGSPAQIKSIVGDVRSSILTEAQFLSEVGQGWVLADGQDVTGSPYAVKTGNTTVPDMRGRFLRGLDTAASIDTDGSGRTLGDAQAQKTAMPTSAFSAASDGSHTHTGSTSTNGEHDHSVGRQANVVSSGSNLARIGTDPSTATVSTSDNGDHSHTLTVDSNGSHTHTVSGGDDETRPANISVNYFIYVGF